MVQAEAELEWQQERLGLQDSRAAAQRRLQDVERVNNQLQAHLARQATSGQAPDQGMSTCTPRLILPMLGSQYSCRPSDKCTLMDLAG